MCFLSDICICFIRIRLVDDCRCCLMGTFGYLSVVWCFQKEHLWWVFNKITHVYVSFNRFSSSAICINIVIRPLNVLVLSRPSYEQEPASYLYFFIKTIISNKVQNETWNNCSSLSCFFSSRHHTHCYCDFFPSLPMYL